MVWVIVRPDSAVDGRKRDGGCIQDVGYVRRNINGSADALNLAQYCGGLSQCHGFFRLLKRPDKTEKQAGRTRKGAIKELGQ